MHRAIAVGCLTPLAAAHPPAEPLVFDVVAAAETTPVESLDDAADDPAIWVDPTDPSGSLIVGTDKQAGLGLYDLRGELVHFLPCGRVNNVDVVRLGDGTALVVASNRTDDTLLVALLDPVERRLEHAASIPTGLHEVYGTAAAVERRTGDTPRLHIVVNDKAGRVEHYVASGSRWEGDARLARAFEVGGQPEGMVIDLEHGVLYVGEEGAGIWRYALDPGTLPERTLVDAVRPVGDHLTADVEGLTLIEHADGGGFLIASSQGSDRFVVYDRRTGEHRWTFRVVAGGGIDGVTETDGIAATAAELGGNFGRGLLVVQDGDNSPEPQNFKLIRWGDVLDAAERARRR